MDGADAVFCIGGDTSQVQVRTVHTRDVCGGACGDAGGKQATGRTGKFSVHVVTEKHAGVCRFGSPGAEWHAAFDETH